MSTVVKFEEPLTNIAARIRAAYERTERGQREWIEGTLELAAALRDARERFPANTQFSVWLAENNLDKIGENDRSALLRMGEEPNTLRMVLNEQTGQLHADTIFRNYVGRFGKLPKTGTGLTETESASNPVTTEPEQPTPVEAPPKTEVQVEPIDPRHPFKKRNLPRAEEVAAIYRHAKTRTAIGEAYDKRKQIWPMILELIDAGLLAPTDACRDEPNLGFLFPRAPLAFRQRYNLIKKAEFQVVKDQIMPAVKANREAIIAAPERIDEIIKAYEQQLRAAAQAAAYAKKVEAAKANLKSEEREVIIFSQRYWPIIDLAHQCLAYGYEELRHAVWTFRELHDMARHLESDNSPRSCGLRIRHAIKFLNGYMNTNVMNLLVRMSRDLEKNPDQREDMLPDMPDLAKPYD